MPRKKSLLGQYHRKSAPVPTRQLRLFSTDYSETKTSSNRPSRSRTRDNKSRLTLTGRTMRHLSLESEVHLPFRRSRSAFATPEPLWPGQTTMSTQRRQACTPMSNDGSIQPWLSTTKKTGKAMKARNEKSEQAEMVAKIQDYFANQDFGSNAIPMSGFHQRVMTLSLFVTLTSHLLSLYYPRHGITMSNYVEKIPQMAKALGYSGNLLKSWLRTANNTYSWPHVLKLLSWLVSLAESKKKVLNDVFSNFGEEIDENPVSSKDLLDYYITTYMSWDQEQMDDIEVATSQLEEKYNTGLPTDEELKALSEEVEQIKQRLEDPKQAEEETQFQQLKLEHDELQSDFEKMSSEVTAKEEALNNLQQELFRLSVQKEELGKDLQEKHRLLQQKQMQVSTQKVSIEEKLLMDEKVSGLHIDIENLEALKRKNMDDICQMDMVISQLLRKVGEEKDKFYGNLRKFDDPKIQELLQNDSDLSQDEICQTLRDFTLHSKNKTKAMKKELPKMTSRLEEAKHQLKKISAELEDQHAKVKSLHAEIEKIKQNLEQRETEHMFESQQIQNKIKRLKSAAHSEELEEACAKLKAETKELEELQEFRARNARTALEVMTQVWADFEKFRKRVADEDSIKKLLKDHEEKL